VTVDDSAAEGPRQRLDAWRALPAETEWLEFKAARQAFNLDDFGRYVSALANEANLAGLPAGWLVFGVGDRRDPSTGLRPVLGSAYGESAAHLNDVKRRNAQGTSPAVSLADPLVVMVPDGTGHARVLMWQVPAAPRGMPVSWCGHFHGRDGESLGALALHELEAIRAQSAQGDWSAETVSGGWHLLDAGAITRARELYARRHAQHAQALASAQNWNEEELLHHLRLAVDGRLTRAAVVLLGMPQATSLLGGPTPRLTWVLHDHTGMIVAHRHFELPLLLSIDELVARIRIIDVPLLPPGQLAPLNLPNYDPWVMREALHNCVAHQDYEQGGRVRVTESPAALTFFNLGAFLPGTVQRVLQGQQPEQRYRNACLANAMVELDLVETLNSGVPRMFRVQRERFFPLPDYSFSHDPDAVSLCIHGKGIDPNYVQALMRDSSLSLEQAIWLDRVQKGLPIDAAAAKALRARGLVEGRLSRLGVSAQVAVLTGSEVEYVQHRGLDDDHFKALVRKLLSTGPQPRAQIDALLLGKLPESLVGLARRREYVRRLLQDMREAGQIVNVGKATRGATWALGKA